MKIINKMLKALTICAVMISCVSVVAMASENIGTLADNISDNSVEFEEKKSNSIAEIESYDISDFSVCETTLIPTDDNTYQVVTEDGQLIATTTLFPEVPYQDFEYCWHLMAGQTKIGTTTVDSYKGMTIDYTVTFSRSGNTWVGLAVYDEKTVYTLQEANNSFSARTTIQKNLGPVSFAIMNNCDHEITYSGTISFSDITV